MRLLVLALALAAPTMGDDPPSAHHVCARLEQSCGICRCLLKNSTGQLTCDGTSQPANCSSVSICDTDAMAACAGLTRVREALCRDRNNQPCPCKVVVPNGYFLRVAAPNSAKQTCFGSDSCGAIAGEADLGEAVIPWTDTGGHPVDVVLRCKDGWSSSLGAADPQYVCGLSRPVNSTSEKLTLRSAGGSTKTAFRGTCSEDINNMGDTWVVRGGAFLSLVGGGALVQLFVARPEVRRNAVDLGQLLFLSLTLSAVALCVIWGSLSKVTCKRQGPAAFAATLSTLVLALHTNVTVYRNLRARTGGGASRPPRRLLAKCMLITFGWVVPAGLGVAVALLSSDDFVLVHENSDEPFLCSWSRELPDSKWKRWLLMDGPALFVYAVSALLASQMLFSWCGCARGGTRAKEVPLQTSLLMTTPGGTEGQMKREGALAELDEGARRGADMAGRQLWMVLAFLLCWTPRTCLTLLDLCDDVGVCVAASASVQSPQAGGVDSPPFAIQVIRHLHALLWPLQGFFLLLAFKRVQNSGVLQEQGSYEDLMARIGYARQEALTGTGSSAATGDAALRTSVREIL